MFSIVRSIIAYLAIIGLACKAQADDLTNRPWLAVDSVCKDSTKTVEDWLGLPGPTERWCQAPNANPNHSRLWVPRYAYFDVISLQYVRCIGWVKYNLFCEGFSYIPTNRSGNEIMDIFFQDDMRQRFPLLLSASGNEQLELATPLELYRAVDAENPMEVTNVGSITRQLLKQVELKDIKAGVSQSCRFPAVRQHKYIVEKPLPSFLQSVQCVSSPDVKLAELWNCTNNNRLPPSILGDRDKLQERKDQEEPGRIRGRRASINDVASSLSR